MSLAVPIKTETAVDILERFRLTHARDYATDINLSLRPAYHDLLAKLGNPQQNLPPVFHVAGTNGKGSVCAFLRSILEAAGFRVHVYTSPHLVDFHERIRLAGELISEDELVDILRLCEQKAEPGAVSYFEVATAAALTAFARHPADFVILETGLGGRLDATNIIDHPIATIITRISYDHREYLGDTLSQIAREKAGIMKEQAPCFVSFQPDAEILHVFYESAAKIHAPLSVGGESWHVEVLGDHFRFTDSKRTLDLPLPALKGRHQCANAGLAIAALSVLPEALHEDVIAKGLKNVSWPARLEPLLKGSFPQLLQPFWELWLDGGHNDSAGEVLAEEIKTWRNLDGDIERPLYLILGMLNTKRPQEFLAPLAPYVKGIRTVTIPNEPLSFKGEDLASLLRGEGFKNLGPAKNCAEAIKEILSSATLPGRILICGSLYLAGRVLQENGFRKP